jgi:xanthine dehydrogenase small subunit
MADNIEFLLNGVPRSVANIPPTTTVLEYLRGAERACGTKEGCAEGDCGACSVVLGETVDGRMRYRAVNGCIVFMPQIAGKMLLTVEGLAENGALHPVQQAMVDSDGSQCGFCTPGFVMALFAFQHGGEKPGEDAIHEALAGNLCRCTGYRPIIAAARAVAGTADRFDAAEGTLTASVAALAVEDDIAIERSDERFFVPHSLERLLALRAQYPKAHLLAGGTDLAVLVTKEFRKLDTVISVTRVPELARIAIENGLLTIGAAVTYTDALPLLEEHWPSLGLLIRRLGSRQIRNIGTVVGNIANASPIGDMPPALIVLGATLVLRSAAGTREMPIEEFFLGYRKTALRADEIIESVRLPLQEADALFRTYKVAKRWDQDISAVCSAFNLTIRDGIVDQARIAFGGMAATPCRAEACEAALIGQEWNEATVEAATAALAEDYQPLSDWRASADYRLTVAANLLRRLFLETDRPDLQLEVMAL